MFSLGVFLFGLPTREFNSYSEWKDEIDLNRIEDNTKVSQKED
jgi:hypothetical protein